jgi:hypothetical protein
MRWAIGIGMQLPGHFVADTLRYDTHLAMAWIQVLDDPVAGID